MITKLLHKMSVEFWKTETGQQEMQKYHMLKDQPGWKVHQSLLVALGNSISLHMLSKDFTDLDKNEKDSRQRSFYYTKEIIDFLMNPLEGANKMAAFERYNQKQSEATKGSNRKERAR